MMQYDSNGRTAHVELGEKIFRWENVCKSCVCPQLIPGVINFELIQRVLQKDLMRHENGRMLLENGIPVEKIEEIWIEFHRIIRIDHLWMFKNLKKLKLDNNCIEKIENLECLIHLNDLDLSFNYIAKIENLDSFAQLETLTLFANNISVIENIDNLKNLKIFSIGRNCISSLESVIYLRRLPNLKSLNMTENVCSTTENFRYYIAKFLPNLVYYEYKMITGIEKDMGDQIFHEEFLTMIESEEEELGKKKQKEKEEEDAKLHMECFVEFLNTRRLFDSFFEQDSEGKALLLIGEKVDEIYETYRDSILRTSKLIFDIGQESYKVRQNEKKAYTSSIESITKQNQTEAVEHMEKFLKQQSELFGTTKTLVRNFEPKGSLSFVADKVTDFNESYQKLLSSIWKILMKLEIRLNDQMLETNEIYEHFLTDSINAFIEDSQEMFSNMRQSIAHYHDELQAIADDYYTEHHVDGETNKNESNVELRAPANSEEEESDTESNKLNSILKDVNIVKSNTVTWMTVLTVADDVPAGLKPYMKSRETLINALGSSRDLHLFLVDNREDLLVSRAKEWLSDAVHTLTTNEIVRNRDKVMEISIFLQKQREQWESIPIISEAILMKLLTPPVIGPVTSFEVNNPEKQIH